MRFLKKKSSSENCYFVFRRFLKIVIWRPMLKCCTLEDNRITYSKSIGSLGLCYTDAEIKLPLDRAIILQASVCVSKHVDKFSIFVVSIFIRLFRPRGHQSGY